MKSVRPVVLCVAPALLLWFMPAARDALLYDRTAILQGEWWRLWTGHWVHFSPSHLAWNLIVLLGAAAWLERLQPGWMLRLALVAAPAISLVLLAGEPAMQTYGGLSGLATGVVVLLALVELHRRGPDRVWWWALLCLTAAKIGVDAARADPLFATFGTQAVRSSVVAHAAGAVTALGLFLARPARLKTALVHPKLVPGLPSTPQPP